MLQRVQRKLQFDLYLCTGVNPASKVRGEFSVQFGKQFRYCKRDEVYFTTLLLLKNGRQNDLISRMLFFKLYKMMVNKVTCGGFRGGDNPNRPPGSAPVFITIFHACLEQTVV